MQYQELFIAAITALKGNLLRTLLTMLGIIIGIASVILIIALGDGATQSITGQLASFGTNTIFIIPGSSEQRSQPVQVQSLILKDAQAIGELPNVAYIAPFVSKATQASANGEKDNVTVQGVGADYAPIQSLEMAQGEFISKDNEESLSRVAVLGAEVMTKLFGEGAQPVGQTVKIDNRSFRVIGVLQEKDANITSNPNTAIYIPVTTAMKILLGTDHIFGMMLQATDSELVNQTSEDITSLLIDRHDITEGEANDFTVRTSAQALATIGSVTGLLTALLAGIAGISLLVGGIGIMNIMLVTVTERTREIGLLKAIGAKRSDILTQFLIEALVLTLVGGAVGMGIGILLAFIITSIAKIPFVISPVAILLAVGVSSIVGIVFGYYPANKAAKLAPIDALRHE